ncbi:MAG: RHS repeat-associated core domain-containing protein, partial [Gammaproteobacteria bacterium]
LDYNGQRLAHIDRDAAGREIKRNLSNALSTIFAYDPQGRLIEQSTGKLDSDARFCSTSHRQYQYNASGQLSCIDDARRGVTHYHYDVLDRLTQVEGPLPEHFVHDPAGNILSGGPRPSPEPQTNTSTGKRLSCYGDAHYDYDTRGNRITQTRGTQKTHYRYNALNQLTDLIQNDVHTEYEHDPLGRRNSKHNAHSRTDFLWLDDVLLSERTQATDSTEADKKTYLFEPNSFTPLAFIQKQAIYHYHVDHLGTPQEITDSCGQVVWSVSYQAYGNVVLAHEERVENNLRLQGQYFDEESGLHYNRFRYYDPEAGRFTQQDPIGLLGGVNSYQYVPNPIT